MLPPVLLFTKSMTDPLDAQIAAAQRHPTYYFQDGNFVILVSSVLYTVS